MFIGRVVVFEWFMNKKLIVFGKFIRKLMLVVVVMVCWIVCWYIIIVIIVGVFLLIFNRVEKLLSINVKIVFFIFLGIENIKFGLIISFGNRK